MRIIHDVIISPGIWLKFSIEDCILIVVLQENYFFKLLFNFIENRTLILFMLVVKDSIWVLETAYIDNRFINW